MEVNKKLIGTALAVVLVLVALAAAHGDLGLVEFITFLAGTTGLGVVSSLAVAAIRIVCPEIDSDYAFFFSMVIAVFFNMVAKTILPYVQNLPAGLYEIWAALVWLAQQVWHYLNPDLEINARARAASDLHYRRL